jgi:4-amino-4-deoxy-L-arabinose transferase-like glycosyltransferase
VNSSLRAPARWQAVVFGLLALIACGGAFVGLSSSGLWIDELFTVHLIHHDGGLGEVFRRALTDTHPPLYYFFLYGWTRLTGLSEVALRLPSAIFAVLAIVVFAWGTRRVLSPTATAFACAVGALSTFWFNQSQNTRSYALCLALAAGLLSMAIALRRRLRIQAGFPNAPFPLAQWLGLSVVGLAASLTHAYLLLALGMVLLFLLIGASSWRMRVALVATGLVVLACNIVYYKMMLHASQQDMQNLWFSNDFRFFKLQTRQAIDDLIHSRIEMALGLMLLWGFQRKLAGERFFVADEFDTRWTTWLAGFVLIGVIVCGIGVSVAVAPSFSDRNLLTCSPFAWLLIGRLYDAAGPRGYTRTSRVLAIIVMLLVGSYLVMLRGRELQRLENWRASAQYVEQLPGCAGQTLPVILPYRFGHASAFYLSLAEHDFFGYYLPPGAQTHAYTPSELTGRHPVDGLPALLASRAANAEAGSGCTLLAWGVHDLDESAALKIALDLASQPGVAPRRVLMQEFMTYQFQAKRWQRVPEAYVYIAVPPASGSTRVEPPIVPSVHLQARAAATLGDQVVVDHLTTYTGTSGPPYLVDVYAIQRWTAQKPPSEDFLAVHRLTCDPPVSKTNWDVWPNPESPGCSDRPLPTSAGDINGQL